MLIQQTKLSPSLAADSGKLTFLGRTIQQIDNANARLVPLIDTLQSLIDSTVGAQLIDSTVGAQLKDINGATSHEPVYPAKADAVSGGMEDLNRKINQLEEQINRLSDIL